jgi:hypothetical protein
MKTIDSLLTDGLSSSTSSDAQPTDLAMVTRDDDEVNIWKKKIAELSAPICGSVSENTSRNGRHSAPELVHSPLAQKSQNADIQRLAKSSPNNENATGCSINHAKTPSTLPMQPGTKSNRDGARTSPPKPPAAITNSTRQPSSPSAPDSQTLPSQSHSPLKAVDLAPSAQLSGRLGGPLPDQSSRVDAEVDYWRRKIAELSAPSDRFADGGFHSTSLPASLSPSMPRGQEQPPLTRLNLSRPKYKTVRDFMFPISKFESVCYVLYKSVVVPAPYSNKKIILRPP